MNAGALVSASGEPVEPATGPEADPINGPTASRVQHDLRTSPSCLRPKHFSWLTACLVHEPTEWTLAYAPVPVKGQAAAA